MRVVAPILIASGLVAVATLGGPAAASGTDAGTDAGIMPHCTALATKLALPPDHSGRCEDKACVAAGGLCAYAGFCFGQACVKKTRDAGRTCTDGAQCESGCLAKDGTPPGPGTGTCSPTQITLGCHLCVSRGVVPRGVMCGD